jgi:hypothetical protein
MTNNTPATIPTSVMREIERRMARAEEMQGRRRHVVKHHGRWHWSECCTPGRGYDADAEHERRREAAASIREARRLIAENGYDVADVCAIARDPGKFAFCDGGGATPENITD